MESKIIYRGPGFCSLLGVAFIVLKLTEVINWSWWWVLLPVYGPIILGIILIVILGILSISTIFKNCK